MDYFLAQESPPPDCNTTKQASLPKNRALKDKKGNFFRQKGIALAKET